MQFKKISLLPSQRGLEFPGGGGGSGKTKTYKEMYQAKWNYTMRYNNIYKYNDNLYNNIYKYNDNLYNNIYKIHLCSDINLVNITQHDYNLGAVYPMTSNLLSY